MAQKKSAGEGSVATVDPTVKSSREGVAYPEGTHPPRDPSDTVFSPDRFEYKDNPDKPDPSSVAQIAIDPLEDGR